MGRAPVKKRTQIFTKSPSLANTLEQKQCSGLHRHVSLMHGRAKNCEIYPDEFCEKLCKAVAQDIRQSKRDKQYTDVTMEMNAPMQVVKEEHHDMAQYEGYDFIDDTTGRPLDKELATAARRLEIDFFRKRKVYTKVPRSHAQGQKIITTRWIDINKGDADQPNYRSRLVGRELKLNNKRLDLFAATPPLESLRLLCHL